MISEAPRSCCPFQLLFWTGAVYPIKILANENSVKANARFTFDAKTPHLQRINPSFFIESEQCAA
jgi:hypothetical protein